MPVGRLSGRGEYLDAQVRRVADDGVQVDQVRPGGSEEDDVGLKHVVLRKDDVDWRRDREAAMSAAALDQQLGHGVLHHLVQGNRGASDRLSNPAGVPRGTAGPLQERGKGNQMFSGAERADVAAIWSA